MDLALTTKSKYNTMKRQYKTKTHIKCGTLQSQKTIHNILNLNYFWSSFCFNTILSQPSITIPASHTSNSACH